MNNKNFNILIEASIREYNIIFNNENIKKLEKDYHCSYYKCNKSFSSFNSLKSHFSNKHKIRITEYKNHFCKLCKEYFIDINFYKSHLVNIHKLSTIYIQRIDKYNLILKCEFCNRNFKNENELKNHVKDNHHFLFYVGSNYVKNVNTFYCPIENCSGIFKAYNNLKKHVANRHNMNIDLFYLFLCNKCNDRFQNGRLLRQHKHQSHNI